MKHSNVRQSPITRDTLLISDADTKVKHRVSKLLLECSMEQLHNELIVLPDNGSLLGAGHAETNDVIISDTMLRYLTPPQLRPMTDNHKMMCGCSICNISNYMQEYLNAWRRKQLKIMKEKAENSRGSKNVNQLKLTNHILTMHFQLRNLHSSLVRVQITESAAFSKRGRRVCFSENTLRKSPILRCMENSFTLS